MDNNDLLNDVIPSDTDDVTDISDNTDSGEDVNTSDIPDDGEGESIENPDDVTDKPTEPEIPIEKSVLLSIKKLLGIMPEMTEFDVDIMIHINSVFFYLNQLGVGPDITFQISGKENLWEEFVGESRNLEAVKSYIFYKVKLVFDPPQSAALISSMEKVINEMEWRLNFDSELQRGKKEEPTNTNESEDEYYDEFDDNI